MAHRLAPEIWSLITRRLYLEEQLALLDAAAGDTRLGLLFAQTRCFTTIAIDVITRSTGFMLNVVNGCDDIGDDDDSVVVRGFGGNHLELVCRLEFHAHIYAKSLDTLSVRFRHGITSGDRDPNVETKLERQIPDIFRIIHPETPLRHLQLQISTTVNAYSGFTVEESICASYTIADPPQGSSTVAAVTMPSLLAIRPITHPNWHLTVCKVKASIADPMGSIVRLCHGLYSILKDLPAYPTIVTPSVIPFDAFSKLYRLVLSPHMAVNMDDIVSLPPQLRYVQMYAKLDVAKAVKGQLVFSKTTCRAERRLFDDLPYLRTLKLGISCMLHLPMDLLAESWRAAHEALLDYVPSTVTNLKVLEPHQLNLFQSSDGAAIYAEIAQLVRTHISDNLVHISLPSLRCSNVVQSVDASDVVRPQLRSLHVTLVPKEDGTPYLEPIGFWFPTLTRLNLTIDSRVGRSHALPAVPLHDLRRGLPHLRILGLHLVGTIGLAELPQAPWAQLETLSVHASPPLCIQYLPRLAGSKLRLLCWPVVERTGHDVNYSRTASTLRRDLLLGYPNLVVYSSCDPCADLVGNGQFAVIRKPHDCCIRDPADCLYAAGQTFARTRTLFYELQRLEKIPSVLLRPMQPEDFLALSGRALSV